MSSPKPRAGEAVPPEIAEVPSPPAQAGEAGSAARYELSPDLVTLSEGRESEAEALRTIRTHIIARHMKDGRRGIAVCGPAEGVGCTFTAVNLAVSLAQVGIATLLIDGDMRSPGVESMIRPQQATLGLKQVISSDDVSLTECTHNEVLPNLSILYAGGQAENAQELLAGEGFRRLMERSLRDYEFTVIDTPPTKTCADARRIGTIIGYTLIVARANVTLTHEVSELAESLQEDGTRVVGTILNEV